ncbi:hypothetical protein [Rhizobium hainanense]|uniref:Uncharacterized protein n=1 Tax=Rhizobium hainanense TaxID=52131 RepID=A0A1C3WG35_9HYPH|nr:hypothetical protein [Rhizobium hainanense]SCB38940.1 hypothetical protein GA0061100_11826 [Rhizobium hainanense]
MPEKAPTRVDVLSAPTLSYYATGSYYVKIDCALCRVKRFYEPVDLLQLCGNISVRHIAKQFRCEQCNRKDYLTADLVSSPSNELVGMNLRRLVQIRIIRKPIWKDVKL